MVAHKRAKVNVLVAVQADFFEEGSEPFVWPRAARYEIIDGFVEPVGESAAPIRPWHDFETWRSAKPSEAVAPYQDLLDLVFGVSNDLAEGGRQLRFVESLALPKRSQQRIAAWCADHGLLGLLPQRMTAVYHQPTWEADADGTLVPKVTSAHRTNSGWRAGSPVPVDKWTERVNDSRHRPARPKAGDLVYPGGTPDDWPRDWIDFSPVSLSAIELREAVGYRDWRYRQPGAACSTQFFGRYLVSSPDSGGAPAWFPTPDTQGFWGWYREPLDEFILTAARFADGARRFVLAQCGGREPALADDMQANLDFFHALARSVGVGAPSEDLDYVPMAFAPSLLAAYAYMVVQDMTRLNLVLVCPECGRVFASRARRVIFCSVRCRNRVSKRRSRETFDQHE